MYSRTVTVVLLFVCSNVTSFFIWMLFAQCEIEKCVRNVHESTTHQNEMRGRSVAAWLSRLYRCGCYCLHILRANEWNLNIHFHFHFDRRECEEGHPAQLHLNEQRTTATAYANERHTSTNMLRPFFCAVLVPFDARKQLSVVYIRRKSMLPNPYTPTSYSVLMKARLPHANAHPMSASLYQTDHFCLMVLVLVLLVSLTNYIIQSFQLSSERMYWMQCRTVRLIFFMKH